MKNSVCLVLCLGIFSSYQELDEYPQLNGINRQHPGRCLRWNIKTVYGKPKTPIADPPEDTYDDYNNDDLPDTDDFSNPASVGSQPRNFTINIGRTVKLPCNIVGDPDDVTVAWKLFKPNGIEVPLFFHKKKQNANQRTTLAEDFTLTIEQAMAEDSGRYMCQLLADNVDGKNEVTYHVSVISSPRITQTIPANSNHNMTPGNPFTFMCEAVGTPAPKISWIRKLKGSNESEIIEESQIAYDKIESSHSGQYTCVAKNKDGQDAKTIEFVVLAPPVIMAVRPVISTSKGYESELVCTSEPNVAPPQVHWQKNGMPVKNDNRITAVVDTNNVSTKTYILRISGTKDEDYGSYECIGRNHYGESMAKVELTGKPLKPVFVNGQHRGVKSYELTFASESKIGFKHYEIAYKIQQEDQWETDTKEFESDNNSIEFSHTFPENLNPGTYEAKVRVQNKNGWSDWSDVQYFPGGGSAANKPKSPDDGVQSKLLESSIVPIHRGSASSMSMKIYLPITAAVTLFYLLKH